MKSSAFHHSNLLICLALLILTALVYGQTRHFDFINYDDPVEVSQNQHARSGITADSLKWAVTSIEAAYWMPLTRVSHLIDSSIFGMWAGGHHLANLFYHYLATLLLFVFLYQGTRSRWPSAFVAAVFALHPLHVESVAWISERKDVLSAVFWFLTCWLYIRYVERPALSRYLLVFCSLILGLLSKPMVVSLPFVLLLLDLWPLRRLDLTNFNARELLTSVLKLAREKIPFFIAVLAAAVVTYVAQKHEGAVGDIGAVSLGARLQNALVSYLIYLVQSFWPTRLAVFYPYPETVPIWQLLVAISVIVSITVVVCKWGFRSPYLITGWCWYLGTLVPVIGFVQVGAQAHADRYMYLPMVGILIMLAWSIEDVVLRWPRMRLFAATAAVIVCACLAITSAIQLSYWRNSESLFEHALLVTKDNYMAQANLGSYLVETHQRLPEAVDHLKAAVQIRPEFVEAHTSLGAALSEIGAVPEAVSQLRTAIGLRPDFAPAHNDLGNALTKTIGRSDEAVAEFQKALQLKPEYAEAHNNLGTALSKLPGKLPQAIQEYRAALSRQPDYAEAHNNLCFALLQTHGALEEAATECQAAIRLKPDYAEAHNNLGLVFLQLPGRREDAIAAFKKASQIRPSFVEARFNLGSSLLRSGNLTDAIDQFHAALQVRPDYGNAHYGLAVALEKQGSLAQAITEYEAALRIRNDPQLELHVAQLKQAVPATFRK